MKTKRTLVFALIAALAPWQSLLAQTPAPATSPTATPETDEEIFELSPFEVSADQDAGYVATSTLAGTRIRTDLKDVGSAITVITKEFLTDIGATDSGSLLQYTTNAEVAGTLGTYAGLGNGSSVDEGGNLRVPGGAQRVRGLAAADNTRDFFLTDIPWDAYNVDRHDIQRGANSILFGLGSPAGIVNSSLNGAGFRNGGSVEYRFDQWGSQRATLDVNQMLIKNVLAVRLDGLWSEQKYQQKQAFQDDTRVFGAIRFDPQLFKDTSFRTSIKVKYENGEIKANRPRTVPPQDSITPWFRNIDTSSLYGGMSKRSYDNTYPLGSALQNDHPYLTTGGINQQQPVWFIDGQTSQLHRIYAGYINNGARNNAGVRGSTSTSLIGQRYSEQFLGLNSLSAYATAARLPGYQFGQYRNATLLDPTVFDFYNNLIDGPNKREWEDWDAYNIDLSQTAFDDRLGVQLTFDRQKYNRGNENLLGNPTLNIDILRNFQDLSPNPNFGRPYIMGGPGSGNSYESDRKYKRASVFGEVRSRDFLDSDFLVKLLGKHRFNGVYSGESYATENRSWRMYANSREWAGYWNQNTGNTSDFKDRPPVAIIYLGSSIAGRDTASGAYVPGITAPVEISPGSVYHFDMTWLNNPVGYGDAWTVPAGLQPMFNVAAPPAGGFTQASNPANYVGWNSGFQNNVLSYDNGSDQSLTTTAQKSLREVTSYAGSWQAFMWNDAIVPTLGWRYDAVRSKGISALPVANNRQVLNQAPDVYRLPDVYPANQILKDHSTAGGVVVHLNKLFERDRLPLNVSLSYNKSNNFQVTDVRRDFFGKPLSNPTGSTKDYGVTLSTKDGKYTVRAIKYETSVRGAEAPVDLGGLAGAITQGIKFRNVFLYRMSNYTWDSREETELAVGRRYWWHPAYVNSAGRPVADINGNPASGAAGGTLQTDAEARAHGDAAIRAWNDIQKKLETMGYFEAWGYVPTTSSALTDRTTIEGTLTFAGSTDGRAIYASQYTPAISSLTNYANQRPQGLTVTADTVSKGYELELIANPTRGWNVSFNASQTKAVRTNVGGAMLDEFVAYMDEQMAGIAGDMRQFNGNYSAGNEVRNNYNNWRGQYTLLKLQEGSAASELRKWRYNVVTNYTFQEGRFKGAFVGGGYRWQDKVVIGYPVVPGAAGQTSFDLSKPYYGPEEDGLDLWVGYSRKITEKINWKIQVNVRNLGDDEGLVPISVQPDGSTWASARIRPVQEWFVRNTFSF